MAIVINEFEVIAEPPAERRSDDAEPSRPEQAPPPKPHDIQTIVRRQRERLARVRAH